VEIESDRWVSFRVRSLSSARSQSKCQIGESNEFNDDDNGAEHGSQHEGKEFEAWKEYGEDEVVDWNEDEHSGYSRAKQADAFPS